MKKYLFIFTTADELDELSSIATVNADNVDDAFKKALFELFDIDIELAIDPFEVQIQLEENPVYYMELDDSKDLSADLFFQVGWEQYTINED
jgi:hypothetical protein